MKNEQDRLAAQLAREAGLNPNSEIEGELQYGWKKPLLWECFKDAAYDEHLAQVSDSNGILVV